MGCDNGVLFRIFVVDVQKFEGVCLLICARDCARGSAWPMWKTCRIGVFEQACAALALRTAAANLVFHNDFSFSSTEVASYASSKVGTCRFAGVLVSFPKKKRFPPEKVSSMSIRLCVAQKNVPNRLLGKRNQRLKPAVGPSSKNFLSPNLPCAPKKTPGKAKQGCRRDRFVAPSARGPRRCGEVSSPSSRVPRASFASTGSEELVTISRRTWGWGGGEAGWEGVGGGGRVPGHPGWISSIG